MIEKQRFDSYEDGYAVGWEEGRRVGFEDGYAESWADSEAAHQEQMKRYWAELITFNARMDHLETQLQSKQ